MSPNPSQQEHIRLFRVDEFHNLEMQAVTYVTHAFPRHWHETFVLQVVEAGADAFYCAGGNYVAERGSIVVLNPGEVHTGRPAGDAPLMYRSFYPAPSLMESVLAGTEVRSGGVPLFPTPVIQDPLLANRLVEAHRALESGTEPLHSHPLFVDALSQLILRHARHASPGDLARGERGTIRRVKQFLFEHYAEKITLDQLAKIAGLSPYHLLRTFEHVVGLPPYAFLTNVRVERAKRLLRRGWPIAQVAQESGFYDQSHFTRHFKRIVGVTPGRYARRG